MQLSHIRPIAAAKFDDPNLVSCAGLVPTVALAQQCGLAVLADERLTVSTDKGANAGRKITSLVAGMVAGADSIQDVYLVRQLCENSALGDGHGPALAEGHDDDLFGGITQLSRRGDF